MRVTGIFRAQALANVEYGRRRYTIAVGSPPELSHGLGVPATVRAQLHTYPQEHRRDTFRTPL